MTGPGDPPSPPTGPPPTDPLKTYRALRIAMPMLVVLLGASVVLEWSAVGGDCWRRSISAYYYTPVQAVFVGSLVAIGACLVAVQGNSTAEDVLLNAAGMLAPIVAFVPIPDERRCRSITAPDYDTAANVSNNVGALLVMAVVAVVVVAVLTRISDGAVAEGSPASGMDREVSIGLLTALALLLVAGGCFLWANAFFVRWAHYAAAFPMFACIVVVVLLNARAVARQRAGARAPRRSDYANGYAAVAALMVAAPLVMVGWRLFLGWDHWLLLVEATLIGLFAVFWALQTRELWHQLRRPRTRDSRA